MTLGGSLFPLELLSVDASKTLAAAATPRACHLARVTIEVGDHLACAVTGHAHAWLMGLLGRRGLLLAVVLGGRGPLVGICGGGLLAIMCVTHGVARLAFLA
jgi:hypothetical protein